MVSFFFIQLERNIYKLVKFKLEMIFIFILLGYYQSIGCKVSLYKKI